MTEPDPKHILKLLVSQDLVTQDQFRRLERALEAGKPLMEALRVVPIVEPVQYIRVCGLASHPQESTSEEANTSDMMARPELAGAKRDSTEGIYVLDLGDMDSDDEAPVPEKQAAPTAVAAPEPPAAAPDLSLLSTLKGALPRYDLDHDEGINLIRDVNELLLEAANRSGGLTLCKSDGKTVLLATDSNGRPVSEKPLDPERGESLAARLRVMARIQPRTAGTHQAGMYLVKGESEYTALVESLVENESESRIAIRIMPGRLNTA